MSLLTILASTSRSSCQSTTLSLSQKASSAHPLTTFTRSVSSSPYGRTHVWKHRDRTLPKPFVPQFPQLVIRVDGSTYTHYTTSPRSVYRLTRDTTNNPLWNPHTLLDGSSEEEDEVTGRLGRFNRRFQGIGGAGESVEWMGGVEGTMSESEMRKDAGIGMVKGKRVEKKEKPKSGRVR